MSAGVCVRHQTINILSPEFGIKGEVIRFIIIHDQSYKTIRIITRTKHISAAVPVFIMYYFVQIIRLLLRFKQYDYDAYYIKAYKEFTQCYK